MSDLIDRQALLDECLNHYKVGNIEQNCTMDWICKTVRNFPTASPWHRVEEPPKENGAYVVWWNYKGTSYWFRGVFFDGRWLFEPGTPKPDYWMPIEPPKEDEHGN